MDISRFDLNLLRIFREVLDAGSVAGAADRLNVTPSAVSHALRRLRSLTDDPLFVRTGNVLIPTEKARVLGRIVSTTLDRLADGLTELTAAQEAKSARHLPRTLRIASPGALELTILPALIKRLRSEAPAWKIEILPFERRSYAVDLLAGTVDFVLSVGGHTPAGQDFSFQEVWPDEVVCVVSRSHPLAGRETITMQEYLNCDFVYPLSWPASENYLDVWLARTEKHRKKVISVPSYAGVGPMLQHTSLAASMPDRTAVALRRYFPSLWICRVEPRMNSSLRLEALCDAKQDEGVAWAISELLSEASKVPTL